MGKSITKLSSVTRVELELAKNAFQVHARIRCLSLARFELTFTPKHGSWLNLVEGFFSKLARSVLRHIRVASKQELKDRIMAAMDEFNRHPVVHTWSYKLDHAA